MDIAEIYDVINTCKKTPLIQHLRTSGGVLVPGTSGFVKYPIKINVLTLT